MLNFHEKNSKISYNLSQNEKLFKLFLIPLPMSKVIFTLFSASIFQNDFQIYFLKSQAGLALADWDIQYDSLPCCVDRTLAEAGRSRLVQVAVLLSETSHTRNITPTIQICKLKDLFFKLL